MKKFAILVVILAVLGQGFAKPTKESLPADEDMLNDDYVDENDDYNGDDDSEDYTPGLQPIIKSSPLDILAKPGESILLPCDTMNTESYVLVWKKNGNLIFQDSIATGTKEARYQIFDNRTIQISKLNENDTGLFECSIITGNVAEDYKLVHNLKVMTKPRIVSIDPSGKHEIPVGGNLQMSCEATGIPEPKIIWSKSGNRVSQTGGKYEGNTLTFENIQKENAGIYQCLADNGVVEPATAAVDIQVTYAPTIKIEKLSVNSAEGYETQLICLVHGSPKPHVSWKKDNESMKSNQNINILNEGHKHILRFLHVQKSDFGSYSCVAENKVGTNEKQVTLSGKATPGELVSVKVDGSGTARIVYKVESNSPISEHLLMYRIKGKNMEWTNLSPQVKNPLGNVYTVEQIIENVEPEVYEITMKSKNTYGWSHSSHHKTFDGKKRVEEQNEIPENQEEPQQIQANGAVAMSSLVSLLVVCVYSAL